MSKYKDVIKAIKTEAKTTMPLSGGATLYLMNIPRRMAQAIINNPHPQQRKLSRMGLHIQRLINLMDSGEWNPLASDAMHFDTQGRCLQGQHRLTALLDSKQSELSNQLVIVHASDEAAMAVAQLLDQSLRVRNIADASRMGGKLSHEESNRTLLSGIVLNRLGFDFTLFKQLPIIRRANVAVKMRDEEPELFQQTVKLFQETKKYRSKPLVAAAIECMRDNPEAAYDFFYAVGNGEPAVKGTFSPQVNLLLTFLQDGRVKSRGKGENLEREIIFRAIRYFNAWRMGEVFKAHVPYSSGTSGRRMSQIPNPVTT